MKIDKERQRRRRMSIFQKTFSPGGTLSRKMNNLGKTLSRRGASSQRKRQDRQEYIQAARGRLSEKYKNQVIHQV